ncbi:PTS sugar transporter subunit IIB [Halodesulfovibrio marinisediminis]|uniref:PTS system, mannose-specific IIB component n=1 Tax=Halodesulfovibrio marinisediminis DSM 17456 TaxID=1121457 RepID=A0A1N6E6Q2_9BACT|nr:PTS sugar transporter subunit IIB [Halodesulfovibrio marinisediminis]SIN78710.1 PTS system, mannose-specific IIB component [Halodesulfovibrio marinisediminis DSM 17456]
MAWIRIDNRLIHGQVIETWIPYTNAKHLLVVNDDFADDVLRQQIATLAIPGRISVDFIHVADIMSYAQHNNLQETLIIVADCDDAKRIHDEGFSFESINIGNLHYAPGKKQLCDHIAISDHDEECLKFFANHEIILDFRCVPNQPLQIKGL